MPWCSVVDPCRFDDRDYLFSRARIQDHLSLACLRSDVCRHCPGTEIFPWEPPCLVVNYSIWQLYGAAVPW